MSESLGWGALQLAALLGLRVIAIVRVQPAWRATLGVALLPVAVVTAMVVAVAATPRLLGAAVLAPSEWWIAAAIEVVLGTVIGHALALLGHVVVGHGTVGAIALRVPPGPWTALVLALAGAAAIGLGLHRPLVGALVDLAVLAPPGDPLALLGGISLGDRVVGLVVDATVLALALATPVLLPAVTVELVAAALARGPGAAALVGPALAPLVRMGAVLIALAAAWSIALVRWAEAMSPSLR